MPKFSKMQPHNIHISNPYQDKDFSKYLLQSGKAKHVEKINDQFVYFFHLFKNFTISYTNQNNPILKNLAKKHNSIYTIIENTDIIHPHQNPQKNLSKKIKEIIPRFTQIIDLSQSEDQILKNMHSKGRYNIRLSKKHNVTIQKSNDIDTFYELLEQTSLRDKFNINPKNFYQEMLNVLSPQNKAQLFMAYHPSTPKPIAGILNTYIDKTCTYYYGASNHDFRQFMAPYLLQWHAILDAKNQGFQTYDFLGVSNPNNPKDTLIGVTNFKSKFGGQTIQFQPAQIIIHNYPLYLILKIKSLLK